MIHYDKPSQRFAAGLSAVADYVDAFGFLHLGGYFASFMSGNSTRMAAELAADPHEAAVAASLVGTFVLGVMLGAFVAHRAGERRPGMVLAVVSVLLAIAAALSQSGLDRGAIVAMVLAMGAENAVFQRNGDVSIGLTYMTGTLVKFGHRLMAALLGGDRWAWLPYGTLWLGLVAGACVGALLYPVLHLSGLWVAAGAMAILTGLAGLLPGLSFRETDNDTA